MKKQYHHLYILFRKLLLIPAVLIIVALAVPSGIIQAADAGYALQFDGNSDLVRLDKTNDILGVGWENTKSVSVWIKPTGPNNCVLPDVSSCPPVLGDHPRFWGITVGLIPTGHHAGQDKIWVRNYDGNEDFIGVEYNLGEWVNITLVHDSGMLRIYKNGFERGSIASDTTMQPPLPTESILYLGGIVGSDILLFRGQIDEVRLWNVALTATEINANMNQSLVGDEAGLKAYYKMSDGTGTTLTDDSVNSWNGVLLDGLNPNLPADGTYPLWVASDAFNLPTPPAAPTNLDATQISALQIDLSWTDQSTNESDFEIERCTGVGCNNFSFLTSVASGAQAYSDISVEPNSVYCYQVRATNAGGASAYTNIDCATTPDIPPEAPTSLSATATSPYSIDLAWTDNSLNESSFEIERCAGPSCTGFTLLTSVAAGTQAYPDINVAPHSEYCYQVRAINTGGPSAYTNIDCATTPYIHLYLPITPK